MRALRSRAHSLLAAEDCVDAVKESCALDCLSAKGCELEESRSGTQVISHETRAQARRGGVRIWAFPFETTHQRTTLD